MPEYACFDIGCGPAKQDRWGMDRLPYPGVSVVADAEHLPLLAGSVSRLRYWHVLEHIDLVLALREARRVLRPGGRVLIRVPHFSSVAAWADPTHRRGYALRTWDYFAEGKYDLPRFRIRRRRLHYKPMARYRVLDWLINLLPALFERHLCYWVGGCHEVSVELEKPDELAT